MIPVCIDPVTTDDIVGMLATLAKVEHAFRSGDIVAVETYLAGVDPLEVQETAQTLRLALAVAPVAHPGFSVRV